MAGILVKLLEFSFDCFESGSNGLNMHSIAYKLIRVVRIWFESLSKGSNFHLIVSNVVQMFRINIGMVRIPFE